MKYYKIKKECDNKRRCDGSIYVADELYTECEKEKYNIPNNFFEVVRISKKKIYFFFGVRFAIAQK